jgi:uncharacterized protein YfbU (UPF0304 family)
VKLTRVERVILANQMRILGALIPDETEASYFERARDALEHGYELEYEELFQHVWPEGITTEDCREVLDTLMMFVRLGDSFTRLKDSSGVDEYGLKFRGYNGNDEGEFVEYVEHVRRKNLFPQLLGDTPFAYRSNYGDRATYQRMLAKFKEVTSGKPADFLTKQEIAAILFERVHPENRPPITPGKKAN